MLMILIFVAFALCRIFKKPFWALYSILSLFYHNELTKVKRITTEVIKVCFIGRRGDKMIKTRGKRRGYMEELTIRLKCPFCRASVYALVSWPGPNLYFVQVTCDRCAEPFIQVIRNGHQPDLEGTIWDYVVDPDAVESDLDEPEEEDRELTLQERLEEGFFEEGQQPIDPEEGAAIIAALGSLGHVPTDRELGIV